MLKIQLNFINKNQVSLVSRCLLKPSSKILQKLAILSLIGSGMSLCFIPDCFAKFRSRPVIRQLNPGDPLPADLFIKLAQLINPAVVNIATTKLIRPPHSLMFGDPFLDFFLSPYMNPPPLDSLQSLGTGFLIRSNGLIVTNTHVVNRADIIKIQLMNKDKVYPAQLVGQDVSTDVALLKIKTKKKLPTVQLGNSSQLQVGEWVTAFGNPYGHGHTMTKGIISAINREIDELNLFPFLQTDASINPGNSGGPLVNTAGHVIGINTATHAHANGISFAIPIDNVKVILKDLERHGRVRRGFIGVQMFPHHPNQKIKGAFIIQVLPNTPAAQIGLQPRDIITRFNNKKINSYYDLLKSVAATEVEKTVPIEFVRNGKAIRTYIMVRENIAQAKAKTATRLKIPSHTKKPHLDLGLSLAVGTKELLQSLNLPILNRIHPVITEVKSRSKADLAGFQRKDIILKVNGRRVSKASEVQRFLLRNRTNWLDVLRYRPYSGQYIALRIQLKI